MPDNIESVKIERITGDVRKVVEDPVTRELPLKIVLNDEDLVTLLCSPANLNYMAAGYLFSEGLITCKADIRKLFVDEARSVVFVETAEAGPNPRGKPVATSTSGRGASYNTLGDPKAQFRIESKMTIPAAAIFKMVDEFQEKSEMFKETGGVHGSALCTPEKILIMSDDIGRHNTVDRILGECILNEIPTDECMVITSGRISSEILIKVARKNIPFLVSRSAPASLGVKLANDIGMTVIGFVRGQRMNIYSHGWRVV
jgi:FdhD protein